MESNPTPSLISKDLHKHAFWLYGVIIGLSIEESLRHVLPHVAEISFYNNNLSRHKAIHIGTDVIQLAVFLTLVVRFFLGSVRYFDQAHISPSSSKYKSKNYALDFFFGLIHFSGFLGLALSFGEQQPEWLFLFWLAYILSYDLIWVLGCRKYETIRLVYVWAFVNVLTLILSVLLYLLVWTFLRQYFEQYKSYVLCALSLAFMLPILLVSLIEVYEIFKPEPTFTKWFAFLKHQDENSSSNANEKKTEA